MWRSYRGNMIFFLFFFQRPKTKAAAVGRGRRGYSCQTQTPCRSRISYRLRGCSLDGGCGTRTKRGSFRQSGKQCWASRARSRAKKGRSLSSLRQWRVVTEATGPMGTPADRQALDRRGFARQCLRRDTNEYKREGAFVSSPLSRTARFTFRADVFYGGENCVQDAGADDTERIPVAARGKHAVPGVDPGNARICHLRGCLTATGIG